jgi:hypothetical protein
MKFRSLSQKQRFERLVKDGKMSQATFDEWDKETGKEKLPDKIPYKPNGIKRGVRKLR